MSAPFWSNVNWQTVVGAVAAGMAPLCKQVSVSASHSGESFSVAYSIAAGDPNTIAWTGIPEYGFAEVEPTLGFSFGNSSYDSSVDEFHDGSIDSTFSYALSGSLSATVEQVTWIINMVVYLAFDHHILGVSAASTSGNIVQHSWQGQYAVTSNDYGTVVLQSVPETDAAQDLDYGLIDGVLAGIDMQTLVNDLRPQFVLEAAVQSLLQSLPNMIANAFGSTD